MDASLKVERSAPDRFVTGATAIGKALGVSPITVRRMIEDGRLKAFASGETGARAEFGE